MCPDRVNSGTSYRWLAANEALRVASAHTDFKFWNSWMSLTLQSPNRSKRVTRASECIALEKAMDPD